MRHRARARHLHQYRIQEKSLSGMSVPEFRAWLAGNGITGAARRIAHLKRRLEYRRNLPLDGPALLADIEGSHG